MKRSILKIALALGLTTGLTSIGYAQSSLEGFGNDVPLSFAVKQIIPEGYLVNFDNGVNQNTRIKWRGGADWHVVLENVARTNGLAVSYMGQLIRITSSSTLSASAPMASTALTPITRGGFVIIPNAPAPAPIQVTPPVSQPIASVPMPAPQEVVVPSSPVVTAPLPAPLPVVQPTAHPLPSPTANERELARQRRRDTAQAPSADISQDGTIRNAMQEPVSIGGGNLWKAPKGDTLDQVLAAWCEKSGWTLVFSSRIIYEMQAGAEFNGDFMEASSALIKSVRARPVPIATFYKGNRVLVINNNVDSGN